MTRGLKVAVVLAAISVSTALSGAAQAGDLNEFAQRRLVTQWQDLTWRY